MSFIRVLIVLSCILFFTTCNKDYDPCEENPDACEKIIRDWEIESLTINGVDSLQSFIYNQTYCLTYRFEHLSGNYYFQCYDCVGNAPSHQFWGNWSVGNNWFTFFTINKTSYIPSPIYVNEWQNWTIINITNESLWLTKTDKYANKTYELHFKAK